MTHQEANPPTPDARQEEASSDQPSRGRLAWLLLDPRGLQTLMFAGGGLIALGVVIWLAAQGVFDEPLNAAIALGVSNLGLIAGGVAVVSKTRYRVAGRAVAMLGCLLLPLNLWFYDAQGLITLDEGGHLWLPALIGCVVYAAVARLLKDSLFVYAFVGGVALSGLLLLADARVERLWEVVAPSALLVTLGVGCVHAERLFPTRAKREEDAAFTRDDFGKAFFRAGHALLASGLGVLLAGRFAGRFYETVFADLGWFTEPDVATQAAVKGAALLLALVGSYTYGYSQLVTGTGRRFTASSLLTLGWALAIGVDLAGIPLTEELGVGMLAVASLGCGVAVSRLRKQERHDTTVVDALITTSSATGSAALGVTVLQLFRAYLAPVDSVIGFEVGWPHLVSSALTLAAQGVMFAQQRDDKKRLSLSGVALAVVGVVAGGVAFASTYLALGVGQPLVALAAAPIGMAVFAATRRGPLREAAAHAAATAAMFVVVLSIASLVAPASTVVALLYTLLAGVLAYSAALTGRVTTVVLACVTACVAMVEVVVLNELGVHAPLIAVSLAGFSAVLVGRVWPSALVARVGRVAVVVAGVAGGLLAANRLLVDETTGSLLGTLFVQTVVGVLAALATRGGEGRRGMWIVAALGALSTALVLNANAGLSFGQRVELGTAGLGVAMLVVGHLGWRKETQRRDETPKRNDRVDINLWLGSLLTAAPLVLGLIVVRTWGGSPLWVALHNGGVLAVGLAMLGSGVLCRLRATTLSGVAMLTAYLVSLLALLHVPDQLQNVAVYMMVGGGVIFGGAVLLSVYRDRLLALPGRIREGEGVFAVLKWR